MPEMVEQGPAATVAFSQVTLGIGACSGCRELNRVSGSHRREGAARSDNLEVQGALQLLGHLVLVEHHLPGPSSPCSC